MTQKMSIILVLTAVGLLGGLPALTGVGRETARGLVEWITLGGLALCWAALLALALARRQPRRAQPTEPDAYSLASDA